MLHLVFYLAAASFVNAELEDILCSQNKEGYIKHPAYCDKFIQCYKDAQGRIVGIEQQCAFATYWSPLELTCKPTTEVTCLNDRCADQPNGLIREAEGNCHGYWECENGHSVPKCCPLGHRFNRSLGCVEVNPDADVCTDVCFNNVYETVNDTVDSAIETILATCVKRAVPALPMYYEEDVEAWDWMIRRCPPGMVFEAAQCGCVRGETGPPEPIPTPTCKPEVFLPFTTDYKDMSGKMNYIGNDNVVIQNDKAFFNGETSMLTIPRFDNIEHTTTIIINLTYTSNHTELLKPQTVVSNGNCGFLPSVLIKEDNENITLNIATTGSLYQSIQISQPADILTKTVQYRLTGGFFTGSVNETVFTVPAEGFLRSVNCPLHVGFGTGSTYFNGQIHELTIYLCDPERP